MRERAELVRGVQAGEVSGVGLQHERKSRSVRGAHRDAPPPLREARLPHTARARAPPPGPTVASAPVPWRLRRRLRLNVWGLRCAGR